MKPAKFFILVVSICFSFIATGQKNDKPLTITGKVYNKDKEPVAGAAFYVDNFKTNFTSKSNGSYKITVSASSVNLEVQSPMYGSEKKQINGQTKIDFVLQESPFDKALSPADTMKKPGTENPAELAAKHKPKKVNAYNNIYQMIQAEVSGVIVSGRSIQIQQGHSFYGSGTPLFVVNGVIVSSIDNLNPLEVKSIKVLKGNETTIYGQQGTNGVLSITLVNGSEREK
jgi:hypothetical protein